MTPAFSSGRATLSNRKPIAEGFSVPRASAQTSFATRRPWSDDVGVGCHEYKKCQANLAGVFDAMIDAVDEGDFRFSDERAEIIKILNNGNAKGFPVLRSEPSLNGKEYNPRAYAVFGPKLVATRGYFEDRALESR